MSAIPTIVIVVPPIIVCHGHCAPLTNTDWWLFGGVAALALVVIAWLTWTMFW